MTKEELKPIDVSKYTVTENGNVIKDKLKKEAEEYGIASREICADVDDSDLIAEAFKDGAEFGYNKANEWHYVKDGDLPKDTTSLYLVRVYSWDFGLSHLYKKYGMYIPIVCEWEGEYFSALDEMAYSNARNIKNCIAWKEIVLPKEIE